MSAEGRADPFGNFRFLVEIDSLIVAGFSEVTGLELEMSPEEYEEGGVNEFTHKLPARVDHPNVVLRKGLTDSPTLWNWIAETVGHAGSGTLDRKHVRVVVLDAAGNETRGWEFQDAYPVKWSGPEFEADGGAVALESVELVHRGISRLDGGPAE